MASVNRVILVGNLGKDPDTKFLPSGKQVTEFSVATTFGTGDNGKTEWHDIKCWDKTAEVASKYLTKGSPVYVEGRIETETWEKDGVRQYRKKIVAERIQLLGKKADGPATRSEAEGDDIF